MFEEYFLQFLPQLPGKKLAGVNDEIRILLEKGQLDPLLFNSLVQPACPGQGMAAAGFLVPLNQDPVIGIQEQNLVIHPQFLPSPENSIQLAQFLAAADVYAQGGLADVTAGRCQLGKFIHQGYGQVIHTVKAQILQHFQCNCLACPGHSGYNHKLHPSSSVA